MKNPLKRDAAAIRRQVLEETARAAAKLDSLRAHRARVLLEADLDEIEKHDVAITAQERTVAILQEKLQALTEAMRHERREQRERDRAAALKKIMATQLDPRVDLATELEATFKRAGELYFALAESGTIAADWPFPLPKPGFGRVDLRDLNREVGWALFGAGRATAGRSHLPAPNNLGLGVAGVRPEGIAGLIIRQNRNIIETLTTVPLGRDEPEEIEQVSAVS